MVQDAGSPAPPTADGPSFERALARLEEIVAAMEQGDLALEESLRLFEEGVALARLLEDRLQAAEMKVEALVRGASGRPDDATVVPFEPPPDAP